MKNLLIILLLLIPFIGLTQTGIRPTVNAGTLDKHTSTYFVDTTSNQSINGTKTFIDSTKFNNQVVIDYILTVNSNATITGALTSNNLTVTNTTNSNNLALSNSTIVVDTIETTLTNSDSKLPTSGAVSDAISSIDLSTKEDVGVAASLLSIHTTTHPIPTTRDDRNQIAGSYETAGTAADLMSTHTTTHPIPTTRDTRNQIAGSYQPLATVLTNTTASFTTALASNISTNNSKVSFDPTSSARLANTNGTNTGDNAGVTSVGGTAPVSSSGGTTPTISMLSATAARNGYMTSTYASKLDGIATGATANGTVTGSGTTSGTNTGDQTTISGNAGSATKLLTARTIDITGDITATAVSFNGTANIAISAAVNNDSHTHNSSTISGLGPADISGLGVADFASANISQWTNNSGYIGAANPRLTGTVGVNRATPQADLHVSNDNTAVTVGTDAIAIFSDYSSDPLFVQLVADEDENVGFYLGTPSTPTAVTIYGTNTTSFGTEKSTLIFANSYKDDVACIAAYGGVGVFDNGTASNANYAMFSNNGGEMYVADESSNVTLLSPHASDAPAWLYDADDPMPPQIDKEMNDIDGLVRYTNNTRKNKLLEMLFLGEPLPTDTLLLKFIYTETYADYNTRVNDSLTTTTWNELEQEKINYDTEQIAKWQTKKTEWEATHPSNEKYPIKKPKKYVKQTRKFKKR